MFSNTLTETTNEEIGNLSLITTQENLLLLSKKENMDILKENKEDEKNHMIEKSSMFENVDYTKYTKTKNHYPELAISVLLHIWIMFVFEIYFFFYYIIDIEREMFIDKIDAYNRQINHQYNLLDDDTQLILSNLVQNSEISKIDSVLYEHYQHSMDERKKILHQLFIKSCWVWVYLTIVLFISILIGYHSLWAPKMVIKKIDAHPIRWKIICIENLFMFLLLGIVEYWFILNIILQYSPVSDKEIQYILFHNLYKTIQS